MRLARALLYLGLTAVTAPAALADDAKPADPKPEVAKAEGGKKVPLRVVRMLPETHQVLLYDKNRGTHVAADVGQDIDGYIVDEIDGDEVTLIAPSGAEVILTAPDMSWRRRAAERKAAKAGNGGDAAVVAPGAAAAPAAHELGPVDPYADAPAPTASAVASPTAAPTTSAAAPLAAGEGGVRVASATPGATAVVPADPYADPNAGITAFADAVGAPSPSPAPAPASKAPPADAKVDAAAGLAAAATGSPAVAAPAPAAPAAPSFTVTRTEIDTALSDFGATAVTFDAAFVTGGLRFDHIAKGTILAKLGLQDGDVLSAVDNQPVRSLDDAASLYARAGTAKAATLFVVRGGKPVAVKVTIR